jgi:PAS domain S-box-containing protein
MASHPFATQVRLPVISALAVALIVVGGLTALGHILFGMFTVRFWNFVGVAIHTSVAFLLLGCALLASVLDQQKPIWVLDTKTTAGFVLGVFAILAAAGETYIFTDRLREDARWVSHTQEVLKEIENLSASEKDLTLSLGHYLITHDESSIADRVRIKAAIQQNAESIRSLTADNPPQTVRISEVVRLTGIRVALSDQIIAETQATRAAQPATAPPDGFGETPPLGTNYPAVGQKIEQVVKEMETNEYTLLQQRQLRADVGSTRTFLLMSVGAYLSMTVLLLGLFLLNTRTVNQMLSEDERRELEAHFRAIFEVTPDGIMVTNDQQTIVIANPIAERMFGYPAGTLAGVQISALVPGMMQEDVALERTTLVANSTETPIGKAWQTDVSRKDGLTFPIEILRSAYSTPKGTFILGVARDLTERKLIEEARSRMAAIVEYSDDAIIGKDLNGIVSSWNRGAKKILGYSSTEMIGRSILRVVPAGSEQEEAEILARIRSGESIEHFETTRQTKDGRLIDVSISVSPIYDAAGEMIGASKIARDITASKHLEQQLRQSQKMEAIGQLTGGIAHDFNNLLGVVLGNLDLLERLIEGNDSAVRRVRTAQKAAMRGADLTRRMLAFSSRQPLHATPTSVDESIQNMLEMAGRALGPEIKITTSLDLSLPLILVDGSGLENALLNLVVNARDAMPGGGSIVIASRLSEIEASASSGEAEELTPGRYVCISVSDTGHGMSRETLERVFEPFFTTKPRGKGTGLGLSMVYGFAKQSGGTSRIYSELEHGTTVSLFLPIAGDQAAPAPAAIRSKPHAAKGQTVLVVDDEVDLLEVAVAYLEDMGYRVLQATDGAQALEVLAREPEIDLLMTDVIMPGGMNGIELARRVRAQTPQVKIMYSSGFPSEALAQRSGTKVDGPLLYKPFQRGEFTAAVCLAMEGDSGGPDENPATKT